MRFLLIAILFNSILLSQLNIEWERAFDGGDSLHSIEPKMFLETLNGGYLILSSANLYNSNLTRQIHLIKTDEFGIEEWSSNFGENGYDHGESVIQNTQGEYITAGSKTVYNDPPEHPYLSSSDLFYLKQTT